MTGCGIVTAWLRDTQGNKPRIPLGPLYLRTALHQRDIHTAWLDYQTTEYPSNSSEHDLNLARQLTALDSKVLAISCMDDMMPAVVVAIRLVKLEDPGRTVLLGGSGPWGAGAKLVNEFPEIDAVVRGEGEAALGSMLVTPRCDWPSIAGVATVAGGVVQQTPAIRIRDLDQYHPLHYAGIELSSYRSTFPISTSRGCPYACSFCGIVGLWNRSTTYVSMERVISEIEYLKYTYGITQFALIDDTFVLHRDRVISFCRLLRNRHLDISWSCTGRINLMTEELVDKMVEAGCLSIYYGVESADTTILESINKGFSWNQAQSVIMMTSRNTRVMCSFIWGYPFETLAAFDNTINACKHLACSENVSVQLHMLQPVEHSLIHQTYGSQIQFSQAMLKHLCEHRELSERELNLILQHPLIFPNFYYYPTDALFHKENVVRQLKSEFEID